jgi:Fe/S biogenesis protein NfuA
MRRKISKVLDAEINPYVASHGGTITLVDYLDGKVYVRMGGGCQGCSQSSVTLRQGVESLLKEEFPETVKEIIDLTEHDAGSNPYYSGGK